MMSTFPLWHIALTAGIGSIMALLLLVIGRRWFKIEALYEMIMLAIVVGFSIFVWRSVGNTAVLNLDLIPAVSPNDVLCPVVTYVLLGLYTTFQEDRDPRRCAQACAVLTLLSFAVNVITI
ncbi:hypothetical protein [Dictyobacter formicarum]|uniref:Histidine kinase N-terminal 7TM region domain-containing protein n=1 Tax=Dictyobacter formicarum TaxID=2778368 RepID=A0ABQ3VGA1_9CHLR|nr:hypothetical protein [Dictyobacter formicarum]GHO84739.1 hypothetical protein KSZ_27450 [Dictyobacter formicarum]